jgi:hypothetical protein
MGNFSSIARLLSKGGKNPSSEITDLMLSYDFFA